MAPAIPGALRGCADAVLKVEARVGHATVLDWSLLLKGDHAEEPQLSPAGVLELVQLVGGHEDDVAGLEGLHLVSTLDGT